MVNVKRVWEKLHLGTSSSLLFLAWSSIFLKAGLGREYRRASSGCVLYTRPSSQSMISMLKPAAAAAQDKKEFNIVIEIVAGFLYFRGHKTAPFRARMEHGRSVFRSKKPRALARGASLLSVGNGLKPFPTDAYFCITFNSVPSSGQY